MIDARNAGVLTGGLTADPERIKTKTGEIIKFRVAADWAGQEQGSDNRSGYFDVTFFTSDTQASRFVTSQIDQGNMRKGSQIQILYRLQQDRWTREGKANSRVILIAESISYAGSAPRREGEAAPATETSEDAYVPERF